MCDYSHDYTYPAVKDMPEVTERIYCKRATQFWVQSLLSQHNALACSHHLARIVREIEQEARKYDILTHEYTPDELYEKRDARGKKVTRTTKEDNNYARVTVKPYKGK